MNNEDLKRLDERICQLGDMILNIAIENHMTAREFDACVSICKEVFYSDAVIKGAVECNGSVPVAKIIESGVVESSIELGDNRLRVLDEIAAVQNVSGPLGTIGCPSGCMSKSEFSKDTIEEAVAHLTGLKNDFIIYVSIEPQEKDVEMLRIALQVLKETALELGHQEQFIAENSNGMCSAILGERDC